MFFALRYMQNPIRFQYFKKIMNEGAIDSSRTRVLDRSRHAPVSQPAVPGLAPIGVRGASPGAVFAWEAIDGCGSLRQHTGEH
jgi:hypothetical protein